MPSSPPRRPSLRPTELAALAPRLRVEVIDETTSTNAVAAERARSGAGEGLVVVAEHQTAGRGRLDRAWETPPRSGLTFSVVLRPQVPATSWPWLPLLTGVAVAGCLRDRGWAVGLKWPNDVLVEDAAGAARKVAGILLERVETPTGPAAVVGVGLNVSLTRDELPVPTATSLTLERRSGVAVEVDRTELLAALLQRLWKEYDAWRTGGAGSSTRLRTSYAAACLTLGRDVRVELPAAGPLSGRATRVDRDGRLVVEGPDGEVVVGAGDVVHVRPATGDRW